MKNNKVWFITGASRGMGVDIARAALASGHRVVATGRDTTKVTKAIGITSDNLLVVKMDITDAKAIETAVISTVEKFGSIDVLINNAGNFYAGFFEELSPKQMESQIVTNLFGPMNVTRAILPVMRKNRSGHIISISSTAGFTGYEFCSAYAASKFGIEGWMESLDLEVSPLGIKTTIVEPGFFRTELLEPASTLWAKVSIEDYKDRNAELRPFWNGMSGKQCGDPSKLAKALVQIANQEEPPKRWLAGADAIEAAEKKITEFKEQTNAYRELSSSLAYE